MSLTGNNRRISVWHHCFVCSMEKKMEQGKPGGKWAGVGAGRLLPEQLRWRLVVRS